MTLGSEDLPYTIPGIWDLGVLTILVMAFLLGCASCRQNKSPDSTERRPPPPSPEPEHPRYQPDLYPQSSCVTVSQEEARQSEDDDDEDDFEDPEDLNKQRQSDMSGQHSAESQKSLEDTSSQATYVNIKEDQTEDYVNVEVPNNSGGPDRRRDHTYLEVLPSNNEKCETPVDDTATRSSKNVPGKGSSLSESRSHSYENMPMDNPPSCKGHLPSLSDSETAQYHDTELDIDYVNVISQA
ncbi:uncharacterized protein LOC142097306 isoform X2 [Mixophyes fleayi]|uniref:uncharacterized protein LOC142097306 isoform X2 n=1 Tax=Mixophyes fleayi TaxID=3061075 RepID=UPI003F4D9CC8